TASVKLFVSQNTDRPQIVLESIDVSGNTTLNHGNIKGTIKDDDGDVKSFEIQITGDTSTSTADDKWVKADKSATSAATSTKLDFEIPKDSNDKQDGNYRIWFKVTDGGNGTFISSVKLTETEPKEEREPTSLELLAMPRVSTLGAPDTEKGTPVKYTVDSEPAEIKKVWVTRKKADGSENERVELAQNDYYGGKLRPSVIIEVDAEDTVTPKSELTVKYSVNGTDKGKINYTNGKFTDTIDFSSLNGTVTLLFSAADKTGSPNTKSFTVWADNTAPNANGKAITNLSPASDTEVTGTISISANVNDSGSTGSSGVDAASVKYFIPKYSEKTQPATDSAWEALSWSQEGLTVSEVLLQLDISDLSKSDATIADGYEGYEIASGQKVYQIPVWFRIADKMGNVSYVSSNSIKYNPDAARPHVKITYPKHNATTDGGKDYVVMGGELRIAGTAEDNVGIQAVYVQYDINGDGKYNKKDTDWLTSNGYTVVNPVFGTTPDVLDETGSFNNWGVKVSGQQSWNTTFDSSKLPSDTTAAGYYSLEIGNENNTDNKTLNIRVLAVDTDDTTHVSAFSDELHISVNNSVPAFTLPDLVQYSDNTYTSEIQRKTYDENIYISGNNWRLETKVTDDDGISQIKNGTTNLINGGTVDSQLKAITNGYEIKLILDTTQQVINVNLTATDNDSGTKKDSNAEYVVKIDNTAPEFKDGTGVTDLVLWQGMYKGSKIDSNAEVANSNGWTTLASKLSESQSGFDKVIFYAKRVGATSGTRLYNLMEDCGQFRDQNRTNVTDLTYKSDVGLYVLSKTGVTRPDEYTVQISETGIGNNKNIRMGGAVFFGGNYKLISEYIRNSDDKITVKVEEAVPETYTSIDFVYGMVVNNQGESRNDDGSVKGDDGDGMVESWTKSGNDYTWDAAFNSLYIPNGPIEIHAVAFDKAGNYRHGSVSTKIANSAPRITSVTLGTDLNFDDTVSDSEKTTFYAIKNSYGDIDTTEGKDVWDLVTRNETESIGRDWTMKNGLTIEPEFVGGTTPFYYSFTKTVGTAAGSRLTKDNAIKANYSSLSSATGHTGSTGKFFTSSSDKLLEFDNTLLNTATGEYDKASNVDGINTYSIIFWDSQEDDSDPMGNGWCILNMELKQDLVDSERPHAFVHPFFWNGKGSGKNSVTWATNSTTSKSEPKGHIELEKDWLSASGYDSTATSG
ncbi:MAG: hypothetical protein HUK25_02340, partial [Treponema sp.]|nr:hypothetical protein [Treponema sp.]